MSIAEGVSCSIRTKAYSSGAIVSNTQAISSSELGATGAQTLRRVSSSLKLGKDTYQSNEMRTDRQIADFRHGIKRVTGSISGELSPKTYFEYIEAAFRGTKGAAITLTEANLTSAAFDSGTSTVTFGGGAPVTLGMRIGDILRFTTLAGPSNNSTNYMITGFSGTSNRVVAIYPPPVTESADIAFTVTTNGATGKSIFNPAETFVARKFGIEHYFSDIDNSHLFTECRIGGFTLQLPSTGMATIEIPVMGRDMEVYPAGGTAPFFTTPTAETTTGCIAAVNGLIRIAGTAVGVLPGLNLQMGLSPSSDAVGGQDFVPEIFLGRAKMTGQATALLENETMVNYFKNETSVSILAYPKTTTAVDTPAITIYLPEVKFGDASVAVSGEGGQTVTMPFQALLGSGATGEEVCTCRIVDSEAV